MTASKLNPNTYRGEERDGGVLYRNQKPTSARSPHWRGKVYIKGIGWYWLSGWSHGPDDEFFIVLSLQELTDDQAIKFCKPKAPQGRPNYRQRQQNGSNPGTDEIPF